MANDGKYNPRSEGERLATLEERRRGDDKRIDDLYDLLTSLNKTVIAINLKMEKQNSFVGGVAFAFSVFGAGIGTAIDWLMNHGSHHSG